MDLTLFDEMSDALRGLLPPTLGPAHQRVRRYGLKLWFGSEQPSPEHYEAQVISPHAVAGASVVALEVGFHAEHRDVAENERVVAKLLAAEKRWRNRLGSEATAGPFLGRADKWRRLSETWADPDLNDAELAVEVAVRLTDYVVALEPARRRAAR